MYYSRSKYCISKAFKEICFFLWTGNQGSIHTFASVIQLVLGWKKNDLGM